VLLLLEAGGEESNLANVPTFQPNAEQSHLNWYNESVPVSRFCRGKSCVFTTGKGLGGGQPAKRNAVQQGYRRILNM